MLGPCQYPGGALQVNIVLDTVMLQYLHVLFLCRLCKCMLTALQIKKLQQLQYDLWKWFFVRVVVMNVCTLETCPH